VDGTPCGPDTFDMCVNGICKPAGCNHMLGSSMQLGICDYKRNNDPDDGGSWRQMDEMSVCFYDTT